MYRHIIATLAASAALVATTLSPSAWLSTASAAVYGGNPVMTLTVDRPEGDMTEGAVVLTKVKLHACAGGVNIWNLNADIDPVAGWSMSLPAGDHCSVDLVWGSTMEIDGDGYAIDYDEAVTTIQLSGASQSADLTPFTVVSGVVHGGNPFVELSIQ